MVVVVDQTSVVAARHWLETRLQVACDALGNKGRVAWSLQDISAVRTLLRETGRRA